MAIPFVTLAILATACGSSGRATPQPSTTLNQEAQLVAFTECMREQGVDMADPMVDADGNVQIQPPEDFREATTEERQRFVQAREACAEHLEGLTSGFTDQDRTQLEDQLLAFAECMRDHGIDFPDPELSNIGQGGGQPGQGGGPFGDIDVDRDDPAVQQALEECQTEVFGEGGPGFGRGGAGRGGNP